MSQLVWAQPENAFLAALSKYIIRWRQSGTQAWTDLTEVTDVTNGINLYDLPDTLTGNYEIQITPVGINGPGPATVISSADVTNPTVAKRGAIRRAGVNRTTIRQVCADATPYRSRRCTNLWEYSPRGAPGGYGLAGDRILLGLTGIPYLSVSWNVPDTPPYTPYIALGYSRLPDADLAAAFPVNIRPGATQPARPNGWSSATIEVLYIAGQRDADGPAGRRLAASISFTPSDLVAVRNAVIAGWAVQQPGLPSNYFGVVTQVIAI